MTALQWIVKEAKSIKKQFPKRFAKWTDYVAQASAIYAKKHKGKSPVGKKKAVKKKAAKKKVSGVKDSKEIKKVLAKKGLKMPHGYKTIKRKRKISGVKKKAASKSTYHKDTASHNVKISVMSGIKIGNLPSYKDREAAREIQLYADNDSMLYHQRRYPILKNLSAKYKKGTFDVQKAAKLWRYYIDAAMQKYHKEFGGRGSWSNLLSVPDRNLLALDYANRTKQEFDLGNLY
jgi:hypothetical protein